MELNKETLREIFLTSRKEANNNLLTANWRSAWENLSNAADTLHAMIVRKESMGRASSGVSSKKAEKTYPECPECHKTIKHPIDGCDMVRGRRGWRQLGMYDG